jgi:alpha-tubulin suppressor-like RCC1 family protein
MSFDPKRPPRYTAEMGRTAYKGAAVAIAAICFTLGCGETETSTGGRSAGGGGAGGGGTPSPCAFAAGLRHTCAQAGDATLWCWGENEVGQLGKGSPGGSACDGLCEPSPVRVADLDASVVEVAAGYHHTCARMADGSLWCWGENGSGRLGDGTTADHAAPIPVAALGNGVAQVGGGLEHTCARTNDAAVWCWGENLHHQLGDNTIDDKSSPQQVVALSNDVAEIAVKHEHACARKTDGSLWCWGDNGAGQTGNGTFADTPAPEPNAALGNAVASVAAASLHTCALKTDGTVWCWGDNFYGQLGDGTTDGQPCGVSSRCKPAPVQAAIGADNAAIAAGSSHTCALKTNGTLWCWGQNSDGQLGNGSTADSVTPIQVIALGTPVVAASAGVNHTCARTADGAYWCWGASFHGEMGNGATEILQATPVQPSLACN